VAGGALSAGTVSLAVKADTTGFGSKLSQSLKGETGGLGAALGGPLLSGLKTFAGPIAAVVAGFSVGKFAKDSIKSFEDLAGSVKSFGRLAGGSTEQVSGLRGAMQLSGVDANAATGAITIFSKNLGNTVGNAKKTADMVAKLGGSFTDASGKIKPMSEILPGLADKFKTMPDGAEKTALAVQLFGRSGAQMVPFLNKGSAGIGELTAKAKTMGLVLDDTSMKSFVDAKVSARNFTSSIQGLKVTLGGELLPVVDSVINVFRNMLTPIILATTRYLASHRDAFLKTAEAISAFGKRAGAAFAEFGKKFKPVFDAVKPALAGFGASFKPVLASIGAAFEKLWPTFKTLIPQVLGLMAAFSPLRILFKALEPILPQLVGTLGKLAAMLAGALGQAVSALLPVITKLAGILSGELSGVVQSLIPVVLTLVGALGPMLGTVLTALMPIVVLLAKFLGQILPVVMPLIPLVLSLVMALLPVVNILLQLVSAVLPPVIKLLTAILVPIMGLVAGLISFLVPALEWIIKIITGLITGELAGLKAGFAGLSVAARATADFLVSTWNAIGPFFTKLWAGITSGIASAWNGIASFFSGLWAGITSGVSSAWNAIVSWIGGVPARFMGNLAALGELAGKMAGWALSAKDAVIAKFGELVAWFGGLGQRLISGIGNLGTLLYGVGQNILEGLINGIKDKVSGAVKAITDAVGSVINGAKSLLGIKSPSRVFMEIGSYTGQGFTQGIESQKHASHAAMAGMVTPPRSPAFSVASAAPVSPVRVGNGNGATSADIAALGRTVTNALDAQARTIQTMQRQLAGASA
jgi:phage-related protein